MLTVVHSRGLVGSLRQTDATLEFTYASAWLADPTAFPLSQRLALQEHPWRGDEVVYFFANLLPEGPVLDSLLQLRHLPRGNVYRLLEAFGTECAGAFSILPEGASDLPPERARYQPYTRDKLAEDLAQLRDNIPLLATHAELRLSLAGAQNKIPVRYAEGGLWLPRNGSPSTHILKPALQPPRLLQDSVLNEAFCLQLAGRLGLQVPATIVLRDPEPVLLIERYDRIASKNGIERLHQLDLCQLAGVLPGSKYEADGGPGLQSCFELVDKWSAVPALDRLRLVDWTLFNYLIGNADAHAKNLSMLYGTDGRLRLAPFYDLLATGYWEQVSPRMAMSIGGERRREWVQYHHWQKFSEETGLNIVQLRRHALEFCAKAAAAKDAAIAELEIPERLARHLASTLQQGSDWIEHRLSSRVG